MAEFLVYVLDVSEPQLITENKLVRLPGPYEPYGLRILLPGGVEGKDMEVSSNYPLNTFRFERSQFQKLRVVSLHPGEAYTEFTIDTPGIYTYTIVVKDPGLEKKVTGYFIVDPVLQPQGKLLPLDGINLLSVVPKWMGPIEEWKKHLLPARELGYNLVHFVPIQQRGGSDSPYSISDQLSLASDLFPSEPSNEARFKVLEKTIGELQASGLLSVIDMVWNHTSFDSEWLWDHPEAGYNLETAPHLRAAYEVDSAILALSENMASYGLPTAINNEADLQAVVNGFKEKVLPELKLYEYYVIDVKKATDRLRQEANTKFSREGLEIDLSRVEHCSEQELGLMLEPFCVTPPGVRYDKHIPLEIVVPVLETKIKGSLSDKLDSACDVYKSILDCVNMPSYQRYDEDLEAIVSNFTNHLRFQRLAENGPRYKQISSKFPLLQTYFTRLPHNERTSNHSADALVIANNGWVWAADPKVDFASPLSSAYLRRDVIIWGDCAKLRYGDSPESNPWLWEHMRKYTESMANIFHGFRIDNCHSTPLPLASYLLDAARKVNPNLYVVAELFTGSEETDKDYVCQLGINSLIREAMQAGDPKELSRLVHRYGGQPVGSLHQQYRSKPGSFGEPISTTACQLVPIASSVTHSLFMDCTHDNQTPSQKRTPEDALPNAALVAMTYCAIGSVKGYDELYPKLLELVGEKRTYEIINDPTRVGIGLAKKQLLNLHHQLCVDGFTEVHVHHENQIVMVHRQNPTSHEGVLLIAHSAFRDSIQTSFLNPVILRGTDAEYLGGYRIQVSGQTNPNQDTLSGTNSQLETLPSPNFKPGNDHLGPFVEVELSDFTRGSMVLIKTKLTGIDQALTSQIAKGASEAVNQLDNDATNILLYRSNEEENDLLGHDHGAYEIPGVGRLPYCGLQGFMSILQPILLNNDLGHPLCNHLRQGRWALDYTIDRLVLHKNPRLDPVVTWLQNQSTLIKRMPSFLFPKYFAVVISSLHEAAIQSSIQNMSPFVKKSNSFVKKLAMCAIQLNGRVQSTGIHPTKSEPCLAAGLTHFATNHMRCWGRDTFISLRGLFICTGLYDEARAHILAFSSSIKHGLLPNLLDSLRRPRYNARDATWWFLQALQDYCNLSSEGTNILASEVVRRFPTDDFVEFNDPLAYSTTSLLSEIVHEIMQQHAQGMEFREWNAGPELDSHMKDPGFDIKIRLDPDTGFLYGGNPHNCGTWMDKMGESVKAGTMGVPSTPRDGAPVEITGLLASTLRWIVSLNKNSPELFPNTSVVLADGTSLEYSVWYNKICQHFEKNYYVPNDPSEDGAYQVDPKLVNRRGIYKDVLGATQPFSDYQLRPNAMVAMTVAPELFDPSHANQALDMTRSCLVAPLGLKTLDPSDWAFRGTYDNSNDSDDPSLAKGFNYHQGPEWGWPLGYFLRAQIRFAPHLKLARYIPPLKKTLFNAPYAGLPELTHPNGKYCPDSCATQAWSSATIIDALYDLHHNQE